MAKAQKTMGALKKDTANPFFKSTYASLQQTVEVIKQAISQCDLYVTQSVEDMQLVTTVGHISGQEKVYKYPVFCKDTMDPQKLASAITYAKRNAIIGIFFLAPEEDDDGNAASGNLAQKQDQPKTPQAKEQLKTTHTQNQSEFVFGFGKHKGKTLSQVPDTELISWANWVEDKAEKPLKGGMKQAFDAVDSYLKAKMSFSQKPESLEDIPF